MSLQDIKTRLAKACADAGRDPSEVALIAVSKVQPNERVEEVLQEGHRLFGENRVQEAAGKWPEFQKKYPDAKVHLIGPLQTNKARQAMELFGAIHTVDRPKLAHTLARLADELGHCPDLFVQVNTGEEPQKAGVTPAEADALVAECRALGLPRAAAQIVQGLSTQGGALDHQRVDSFTGRIERRRQPRRSAAHHNERIVRMFG